MQRQAAKTLILPQTLPGKSWLVSFGQRAKLALTHSCHRMNCLAVTAHQGGLMQSSTPLSLKKLGCEGLTPKCMSSKISSLQKESLEEESQINSKHTKQRKSLKN